MSIVGTDEGEGAALRELAVGVGVSDRVRFLGAVYAPEVHALYRSADVFLLAPSYNEGTSLASLDAAIRGCALIVSPQVGVPGLEDGVSGWTVPPTIEGVRRALLAARDAKQRGELTDIGDRAAHLIRSRDVDGAVECYAKAMEVDVG